MRLHTHHLVRPIIVGLCSIVLVVLIVACDAGNGPSGTTSTPTPSPTLTPTPTPSPTPTPLVTYTGTGYTIGYPKGWQVTTGSDGFVSFSDPQGVAYLAIRTQPNPQGAIPPDKLVDAGLTVFQAQATNYQQISIAPTTTVAGETWSQGAATGDITPEGQTSPVTVKVIVLATNHPPSSLTTRGFTIAYGTAQRVFDLANSGAFQPMLQSFQFT